MTYAKQQRRLERLCEEKNWCGGTGVFCLEGDDALAFFKKAEDEEFELHGKVGPALLWGRDSEETG